MTEMIPNKINVFTVNPKDVLKTYYNLFKQFNEEGILRCEIDIVLSEQGNINYNYQFIHSDSRPIVASDLDEKLVQNIIAIAQEHCIENIQFGVLFVQKDKNT